MDNTIEKKQWQNQKKKLYKIHTFGGQSSNEKIKFNYNVIGTYLPDFSLNLF